MKKNQKSGLILLIIAGLLAIPLFLPTRSNNNLKPSIGPTTPTPKPSPIIIPAEPLTPEQQLVMDNINSYRVANNLKEATTEASVCKFAEERANEVSLIWTQDDPNQPQVHEGFLKRKFPHGGYWTENLARYFSPSNIVPNWIASAIHNKNLLADTPYICVKNNGIYWAMIGWNPEPRDAESSSSTHAK